MAFFLAAIVHDGNFKALGFEEFLVLATAVGSIGQIMGKLPDKVGADEAATVPSTAVETFGKLDVDIVGLEETPVAVGSHEA